MEGMTLTLTPNPTKSGIETVEGSLLIVGGIGPLTPNPTKSGIETVISYLL